MSTESTGFLKGLPFEPITDRDTGLKVVDDIGIGYFVVAAIHGVLGAFVMRGALWDARVIAGLALSLKLTRSRVIALVLLLFSAVIVGSTIAALAGIKNLGGRNILLALPTLYMGIRATQATFALARLGDGHDDDGIDADTATQAAASGPLAAASSAPSGAAPRAMPCTFSRPAGRNHYE